MLQLFNQVHTSRGSEKDIHGLGYVCLIFLLHYFFFSLSKSPHSLSSFPASFLSSLPTFTCLFIFTFPPSLPLKASSRKNYGSVVQYQQLGPVTSQGSHKDFSGGPHFPLDTLRHTISSFPPPGKSQILLHLFCFFFFLSTYILTNLSFICTPFSAIFIIDLLHSSLPLFPIGNQSN